MLIHVTTHAKSSSGGLLYSCNMGMCGGTRQRTARGWPRAADKSVASQSCDIGKRGCVSNASSAQRCHQLCQLSLTWRRLCREQLHKCKA